VLRIERRSIGTARALIESEVDALIGSVIAVVIMWQCWQRRINPVEMTTQPYPGFPTDLQAQLMALLCLGDGMSVITERVFPDRFTHVGELNRMGGRVRKEGSTAVVQGVKELQGAPVMASDLRASAALVLASLVAKGQTKVDRVYHIDRGYEKIEQKLAAVGRRSHLADPHG